MNISTELSILLFWREEILMICFMFYLHCLNNKEKLLKLSIYKKMQFTLNLRIWISINFKMEINILQKRGWGGIRFSWHL